MWRLILIALFTTSKYKQFFDTSIAEDLSLEYEDRDLMLA